MSTQLNVINDTLNLLRGKKRQVHSGGLRPADDQKLSEHDRRNGSRVRPREDDLCGSASRDTGEGSNIPRAQLARERFERPVRNGIRPRGKSPTERNRKARKVPRKQKEKARQTKKGGINGSGSSSKKG